MADQGATTAAGAAPKHVYRFSAQIIGTDPAALARIQNALMGKVDGSILDCQVHIVKDDAHPAAKK